MKSVVYEKVLKYTIKSKLNNATTDGREIIQQLKIKKEDDYIKAILYLESIGYIKIHRKLDPLITCRIEPSNTGMAYELHNTPWYRDCVLLSWITIFITLITAIETVKSDLITLIQILSR